MNISPTFWTQLFLCKSFTHSFLYLHFSFALFWQKNINTKSALIMLVKLTPCFLPFDKALNKKWKKPGYHLLVVHNWRQANLEQFWLLTSIIRRTLGIVKNIPLRPWSHHLMAFCNLCKMLTICGNWNKVYPSYYIPFLYLPTLFDQYFWSIKYQSMTSSL
jgi:hypothetical protein